MSKCCYEKCDLHQSMTFINNFFQMFICLILKKLSIYCDINHPIWQG
ncbi:hypothetical protein HMPREF9545_00112 [Escherichia coli MS 16-3]|nr:hypothetical protein HMPREF9545_00112 [Escherichia coli MS 16-3]